MHRTHIVVILSALTLSGCVVVPADEYYYADSPPPAHYYYTPYTPYPYYYGPAYRPVISYNYYRSSSRPHRAHRH